jgi:hypothetical protein
MRCESRDAGKNVSNQIALDRSGRLQLRAAFFLRKCAAPRQLDSRLTRVFDEPAILRGYSGVQLGWLVNIPFTYPIL